jgi:inorganic pyrophosphatase
MAPRSQGWFTDDDGELLVVVESPRGSSVKLKYLPESDAFKVSRSLPIGLTYPFDGGFVPGTRGDNGDPIDAFVLHDASTFPGVILPCRAVGLVRIEQEEEGKRERNDRIVALPTWHDQLGPVKEAAELPRRLRNEIEQFFLSTAFFTAKKLDLKGWADSAAALELIQRSVVGKRIEPVHRA